MSLFVIYQDIKEHGIETIFVIYLILRLIEIAPIRINPWSTLVKSVRHFFTGDLAEKIEQIETNQKDISDKFEKTQNLMRTRFCEIDSQMNRKFDTLSEDLKYSVAMSSRYRLIRAADELKNGIEISPDHLEVLLQDDLKVYKMYCDNHPEYINHKGQKSVQILLAYESMIIHNEAEEKYKKVTE